MISVNITFIFLIIKFVNQCLKAKQKGKKKTFFNIFLLFCVATNIMTLYKSPRLGQLHSISHTGAREKKDH